MEFFDAMKLQNHNHVEGEKIFDDGNSYTGAKTVSKVAGVAVQLDFEADGIRRRQQLNLVVDALESDTGDETYSILVTQSNDIAYASPLVTSSFEIPRATLATAKTPATFSFPIHVLYRYMKVEILVGGTIVTGMVVRSGYISPS